MKVRNVGASRTIPTDAFAEHRDRANLTAKLGPPDLSRGRDLSAEIGASKRSTEVANSGCAAWSEQPSERRSPRSDRGYTPADQRSAHRDDYRAEMEHGRIGASRLHREPVSPVVVILLILCAVLCLAAILSGPRGVLIVLAFAGTVFGLGCLLGWALARWA